MADDFGDMFNLTLEQECEREAEQREIERQESERRYQEAQEEEKREAEQRRRIEEALHASTSWAPSTPTAITSAFAFDAADSIASDLQSKKEKKKKEKEKKKQEKLNDGERKEKPLLSESAVENVQDLFAEDDQTGNTKPGALKVLLTALPGPESNGNEQKNLTDAEKEAVVVTPPPAYQNSTPEKSKSAPETPTSEHNPTQNKAVSSTGAGIARSPSQTPSGTKTATVNRQSDSSIATVNIESVKTRAKGKQQLQDVQLSEPNSLDLSTICRPSSIESMECHPPSPHHDRVSVTTADGYDTTPESVFTPDVGAGQQHTVTVKSTTASDMVKSPPLSTFAPLPAAADNSKALDHVIRNSSEDSGANAQPYPARRKAEAMDVREKRPVHSHRHAVFYQPDDQGEEFTDVNLFAVKQEPKFISQEPAEQNEFDNSVGSTAVKCEENSAVQSEESTRNRAMSLADQKEAKAAVCSEILTRAIDDIDCWKPKAPPRPVKRARKDGGTMFYDEQGKSDIDPMKLVRLIDRQPPSPNPVLAAEPNAKVSETAGLGYEPAKNCADSEVPLCRRFEDVDEISEDKKASSGGLQEDSKVAKDKVVLKAMKICFIDLVQRRLTHKNQQYVTTSRPLSCESDMTVYQSISSAPCKTDVIVNDDTVVSAHVPMVRQTSKLDQSRTELWSRSEDRKASLTQSGNAVGSNQCKSGKRKESIIEQEIRLQKQREEEIHAERQRISRHRTTPTSKSITAGDQPDLPQIQSTPKTLKAINGGVSDQLDSATKSMEKVAITESPEYVSESPIQRDIRINKQREAELKSARGGSINK